jgi:hypothetical protein
MASTPHEKTRLLEARVMKPSPGEAPEVGTSTIDDHVFVPREGQPWERCATCNLAESAHTRVDRPYQPSSPRALGDEVRRAP